MHANGGQIINISRIVDHPKYSYVNSNDYDISLLKLSETLKFSENIQPIALPNANTEIYDRELCMTTGWGKFFYSFFEFLIPFLTSHGHHKQVTHKIQMNRVTFYETQ